VSSCDQIANKRTNYKSFFIDVFPGLAGTGMDQVQESTSNGTGNGTRTRAFYGLSIAS
jgi:hypothetical protein